MRKELAGTGVKVTNVLPGVTIIIIISITNIVNFLGLSNIISMMTIVTIIIIRFVTQRCSARWRRDLLV